MYLILALPHDIFWTIDINPFDRIKDIKEQISIKTKFLSKNLSLYLKYKKLEDDKVINEYKKIQNDSIIKCYVKKETAVIVLRSMEIIDNGGFVRNQASDIDKSKETALIAFKVFIKSNKDTENKPQKLRIDQFAKILTLGETIQPKLIKTIFKELNLEPIDQLDENQFLTYFKAEISNY